MNINSVVEKIMAQKESIILEQLNDLIKRGLLVVEMGPMELVHSYSSAGVELRQQVRLTLKDKEYIEKLEAENNELKNKIAIFQDAVSAINNKE